jgi:hypothetical protein
MDSLSLRAALAGIGEPTDVPLAIQRTFGQRAPRRLRTAVAGMSEPGIGRWTHVGDALRFENTDLASEAQGATTDGRYWYICSNTFKVVKALDGAKSVHTYKPTETIVNQILKDASKRIIKPFPPGGGGALPPPHPLAGQHFGAPAWRAGWLLVPVQHPYGVWRCRTDGDGQTWRKAAEPLPDNDLFAWCDIHPVTGVLYTSNYGKPKVLLAYDADTLARRPADDIPLRVAPLTLDDVQGGCFTDRGRLLLVRCKGNAVFCYSSLNGHCFGAQSLGDYNSTGSEVESVTIRPWQFGNAPATVHILELDNDYIPFDADDFYLHSYQVPHPERL